MISPLKLQKEKSTCKSQVEQTGPPTSARCKGNLDTKRQRSLLVTVWIIFGYACHKRSAHAHESYEHAGATYAEITPCLLALSNVAVSIRCLS